VSSGTLNGDRSGDHLFRIHRDAGPEVSVLRMGKIPGGHLFRIHSRSESEVQAGIAGSKYLNHLKFVYNA